MAFKSIWSGTVSFGMVAFPVRLGPAADKPDTELHAYRRSDGAPVGVKPYAKTDGELLEWSDVFKGYELPDGRIVEVRKSDRQEAYGSADDVITVRQFVMPATVPREAHDVTYWAEPGKGGERAYRLLHDAMHNTGLAAEVTFALRDKEAAGILYADGHGRLKLSRLLWHADQRDAGFDVPEPELTQAERDMALSLVMTMAGEFDWASHKDTSAEKLAAVILAKADAGEAVTPQSAASKPAPPQDLAEALRLSVEKAKADKAPVPRTRAPRTGAARARRAAA